MALKPKNITFFEAAALAVPLMIDIADFYIQKGVDDGNLISQLKYKK